MAEEITNCQIGDITGYGTADTDYFSCYKVVSVPSTEQISFMNEALTTAGSTYQFNGNGELISQ